MRAVPTDLWIFLAGLVAGSVNAAAGGGTLLAFPVLIGVAHLSPLVANTTCTVGLLPGIIASTGGYWRELSAGLRRDARRQLLPSALGGVLGAWLLLSLGGRVFARVVPWLLVVSAVLIAVQPLVNRWLTRHRPEHGYPAATVVVPFRVSVYAALLLGARAAVRSSHRDQRERRGHCQHHQRRNHSGLPESVQRGGGEGDARGAAQLAQHVEQARRGGEIVAVDPLERESVHADVQEAQPGAAEGLRGV